MKRAVFLISAWLFAAPVFAADIAPEVQVQLQSAMQTHIDDLIDDGSFTYVDAENGELKTVYPANVHPMVLAFGKDYFVCSTLVDESGESVTADFLVRKIGDDYKVVQTILGNRALVKKAMSKAK